ncbi:MAG TPA: hypothetical protein VK879_15755 [Candidatus Sulfomarinibacteraceae bacterium]|nr:hypothetical protein [Candidatus Sulfomarinibacteraceae bacterium]
MMTEEHEPNVEELKSEERIKIEVEEEEPFKTEKGAPRADVSDALRDLGRQFAETLQSAWNSQERREFEAEVKEGVRRFGDEVNKVFSEAKESPTAKKVKEEAEDVRGRVESGELGRKARSSMVEGLQWLSQELARLAEQFSPPEEQAGDDEKL